MHTQISLGLYHLGCTEELVVDLYLQQGMAVMVNVPVSDLDTVA